MDDLISRQEAIDAVENCESGEELFMIKSLPSIDAVQVIRCKDCKHWDVRYCHNQWWGDGHVYYTPPIKTEDGYCDWAERKES